MAHRASALLGAPVPVIGSLRREIAADFIIALCRW